ncbi:hypothetical protein A6K76_12925 [Caryophanon latum]|uniref:SLH domain-containing protein n=2 Tax=Caryophanon latum TaxID=33977 RepID=A0A1C0YPZ5_9BACL|nr:hypothetical protein A6K76_12925 [Caryophanon latum]
MATFAAVAAVCAVAPQAEANETIVQDGVHYEIFVADNGKKEARIVGREFEATTVSLPDTVKGVPVTEIAQSAFVLDTSTPDETLFYATTILKLPAQLKKIGAGAFGRGMSENGKFPNGVILPETVEIIEGGAFDGVETPKLVIPTTVKVIEDHAFSSMNISDSAHIPASLRKHQVSIYTNNANFELQLTGNDSHQLVGDVFYETFTHNGAKEVRVIGLNTLSNSTTITVPETIDGLPVTEIANSALSTEQMVRFNGSAVTMRTIELPATIRKVGEHIFHGHNVTFDITTLPNLEEVGTSAFTSHASEQNNVYNSKPFVLPKTLHTIGAHAFENTSITDVHIHEDNNIGEGAFIRSQLQQVTMDEGITHIADSLFSDNAIHSVTLPSTLKSIGANAFTNNKLTTLSLPASVTAIGSSAFSGNALTAAHLSSDIEYGTSVFAQNAITDVTFDDSIKAIPAGMFDENELTSVKLPSTLTHIGALAFRNNALQSIELPTSITHIGEAAFRSNDFTAVHMSKHIEYGAYVYAANDITKVTFDEDVTTIPAGMFTYNQLANVTLPHSITHIEPFAFSNNALQNIELPRAIAEIGEGAFQHNNISDLVLSANNEIYGKNVFLHNPLTSVSFAEGTTHIKDFLFDNAKLTNVTIPEGVTHIGKAAFRENALTSITIPNSVTTIGDMAFADNQLTTVVLGAELTTLGSEAFRNNALTQITIPSKLTEIPFRAFVNNKLSALTIPATVKTIHHGAFRQNELATISIPTSVTSIGSAAFAHNKLKKLHVPASIANVETSTFAYNELEDVTIEKASSIGSGAFMGNRIHTLSLPNTLKTIGREAFHKSNLKRLILPEGVEAVGEKAFQNNQITSVTVPASLKTVDLTSFYTNPLSQLILKGSNTVINEPWLMLNNESATLKGLYTNESLTVKYERIGKQNGKPQTLYVAWQKEAKFKDIAGHWAQGAIESFTTKGYINGYPDGTFKPGAPIQRKHVARILNDVFKFESTQTVADFTDVPKNHAYYEAISAVQQAGIFSGDGGKFQPEANLTRGQLAKVLVLAAGFEPGGKSTFKDTPASYWGTPYVSALADLAIVKGTDGFFNPQKPITRAQFVSMTSLALEEMERRKSK